MCSLAGGSSRRGTSVGFCVEQEFVILPLIRQYRKPFPFFKKVDLMGRTTNICSTQNPDCHSKTSFSLHHIMDTSIETKVIKLTRFKESLKPGYIYCVYDADTYHNPAAPLTVK
jgi:hypothetical protein